MSLRAWSKTVWTATGSPANVARRGLAAGVDGGAGRVTFTLDHAIDRTESCVLCSWVSGISAAGTAPIAGAATLAADQTTDALLRVHVYSSGTEEDARVGTGFCVAVFDNY